MKITDKTIFSNILRFAYCYWYRLTSPFFFDNISKWKKLKGKYKGKRCFLIANGPSLNQTPLYLLKDEYTIMFNRAGLIIERLNYIPSFYMIADGLVGRNIKDEIAYYIDHCKNVFVPDINKGELVKFTEFVPFKDNVLYMYETPKKFSHTLPYMNVGGTVIVSAFQVLMYLGFDEVIVVGNDMNYVVVKDAVVLTDEKKGAFQNIRSTKDDDPNHFDPRYFGKGKEYHQPTSAIVNKIFSSLDRVASEYEKHGVKIVNAGYNSSVKSFPKMDFYEALGYPEEKIDSLFDDLIKHLGFKDLATFLSKADSLKDNCDWESEKDIISVPMDKAATLVKQHVLEYLPIGPYKDIVYFVRRTIIDTKQ